MSAFLDLVACCAPTCAPADVYPIGNELLGSEATLGWEQNQGQLSDERLRAQIQFLGMALQSLVERVDQAEALRGSVVLREEMQWLVRVGQNAFRYHAKEQEGQK